MGRSRPQVHTKMCEKVYEGGNKMEFEKALTHLKAGAKIARSGWNGKKMFIYLVNGQTIPAEKLRNEAATAVEVNPESMVTINSHIDMKAADGTIVVGWLASQTDLLANDWEVV